MKDEEYLLKSQLSDQVYKMTGNPFDDFEPIYRDENLRKEWEKKLQMKRAQQAQKRGDK